MTTTKAPKIGAIALGIAVLTFVVALFGLPASEGETNVLGLAMVGVAGLLVGVGGIAGFYALRQGVTGGARWLSVGLAVMPALLGVGLATSVALQMRAMEDAVSARPLPQRGPVTSTSDTSRGGPPAKVELIPAFDATAPTFGLPAALRVQFSIQNPGDVVTDRNAFTKGTWFLANVEQSVRLVTAGHLFGPFAGLSSEMNAAQRMAVVGDVTLAGQDAARRVLGVALSDTNADIAGFAFAEPTPLAELRATAEVLHLAAVPEVGAPVWVLVDVQGTTTAFKAVVAARSGVVAAYMLDARPDFAGVSGAPIVDAQGRAVAVFIGKSESREDVVIVGTPLLGAFAAPR